VWTGFWTLQADRPIGLGGAGPIPFTALDAYARRHDLHGVAFEQFRRLIGEMADEQQRLMEEQTKTGRS
jgi:hypothetical protein